MPARGEAGLSLGQQLSLTITQPSRLWVQPTRAVVICGLLGQWLVLGLGRIIALPENRDLDHFARGRNYGTVGMDEVVITILGAALTVTLANAAWAALIWLATALLGMRASWSATFAVASVSLLPFILGRAVGLILLALWMPLSRAPAELWAWRLWPFSTGLATWLPDAPRSISLGWAFLSVFDVFGLWGLWLTYAGLIVRLQVPAALRPWLALLLVLLCCAVALGLWQTGQYWLARST